MQVIIPVRIITNPLCAERGESQELQLARGRINAHTSLALALFLQDQEQQTALKIHT